MRYVGFPRIITIISFCAVGFYTSSAFALDQLGPSSCAGWPLCTGYPMEIQNEHSSFTPVGGQGNAQGSSLPQYPTIPQLWNSQYWRAHHLYTTTGANASPTWARDLNLNAVLPLVAGTQVNQKLSACLNGWNGTPGVGKKMDCVEAPKNLNFDQLYSQPDSSDNFSEGIVRPNRLYLTNAAQRPVVGFYREDGVRCVPSTGEPTPNALLTQLDDVLNPATTPNTQTFLQNANYDTRCTFVVRTAIQVTCPPVNGTAITWSVVPYQIVPNTSLLRKRCAVAEKIKVEFDIQDISQQGRRGRTALRTYSSLPRTNAVGDVIQNEVQVGTIDYRSILIRKTPANGTCPTQDGTAGGPLAPGLTPVLTAGGGSLCQME